MVNITIPVQHQFEPAVAASHLCAQLRAAKTRAEREALWSYVQRNRGVLMRYAGDLWQAYRD